MKAAHDRSPGTRSPLTLQPALVHGFAIAIALWIAWYITHLPWLGLDEHTSLPILLMVWLASAAAAGWCSGSDRSAPIGLLSGLISTLPGLMLLGTKLAKAPEAGDASTGLLPDASLRAAGFVAMGIAIGGVGGYLGGAIRGRRLSAPPDCLSRFAIVTAASVAPLLVIGGMVTSTNSGMAVPDWPNTYGSNMFLYPLGPRIRPDVYLEHSHRLFATLVGLSTVVLTLWTLISERRRWVKALALVTLAVVIGQGALGGGRVLGNSPAAGMVHGVLAQLTFGLVVVLAVALSPAWKSATTQPSADPRTLRRLRFFTTGALHAMILQLVLGAMYRHLRDRHSLISHIVFSVVVLILASIAGSLAASIKSPDRGPAFLLRRFGKAASAIVGIQFLFGWASFLIGGKDRQAADALQALVRTAHQANGGLLLATLTALFFWTRRFLALQPRDPA